LEKERGIEVGRGRKKKGGHVFACSAEKKERKGGYDHNAGNYHSLPESSTASKKGNFGAHKERKGYYDLIRIGGFANAGPSKEKKKKIIAPDRAAHLVEGKSPI